MNRKLRMGMIGGGVGSFIGNVHRIAAIMDNEIELVAGALSSDVERSLESGKQLYLDKSRTYYSFIDMVLQERDKPEDEKLDLIAIVAPNHVHYHAAKLALENGFPVICDKPVTFNYAEAVDLQKIVEKTGLPFAVTHAYTGYPMVKEAREIIRSGKLGAIRKVVVDYPQGWLSTLLEQTGQKQARWRTDPNRSGISCTMGDIGIHAENLAEYVTGLRITELIADITTFVEGRKLDDDGSVLLRFDNGAKGVLTASQISAGEENDLSIKVYGEQGGLQWKQTEPNTLRLKWLNKTQQVIRTGVGELSESANLHTRLPAGHPEGYLEAFANIYRNFAFALKQINSGKEPDPLFDYPGIEEGVRGMAFIEKVVKSSEKGTWVKME